MSKHLGWQGNHRIDQVFADELLSNLPFCPSTKEHSQGHDCRHAARLRRERFDHVADKRVIAGHSRRDAAPVALMDISLRHLVTPVA
ncbi:hypothetical protein D3C71_1573810 [compost metagenome]